MARRAVACRAGVGGTLGSDDAGRGCAGQAVSPPLRRAGGERLRRLPSGTRISGGHDLRSGIAVARQIVAGGGMTRTPVGTSDLLMITFDALRYDVAQSALHSGRTPFLAQIVGTEWECRHSPGNFTYAA